MKPGRVFVLFVIASQMLCAYGVKSDVMDFLPDDLLTYSAEADIFITLPMTHQNVHYTAKIISMPSAGSNKELCPSDFLIELKDTLGNKSVYSYFDGNYFVYSGGRLREYHWERDSLPFISRVVKGKILQGIHKSGMASALVPVILSENIKNGKSMLTHERDTLINGNKATILKAVDCHNDVVIKKMMIVLSKTDRSPLYYKLISNPGTLSEQIIIVHFEKSKDFSERIDEKLLIAVYPEIFKE